MSYFYDDVDDDGDGIRYYRSSRKNGKPMGRGNPHLPNKAERKLLTSIQQKSGQTEEEVRAVHGNRVKLAVAAKSMHLSQSKSKISRYALELKRKRRAIAWRLNVPVWDPKVETEMKSTISR